MQISDVDTDFYIKEKLNKIKQTTLTPTIYIYGMRHKINPDEQPQQYID